MMTTANHRRLAALLTAAIAVAPHACAAQEPVLQRATGEPLLEPTPRDATAPEAEPRVAAIWVDGAASPESSAARSRVLEAFAAPAPVFRRESAPPAPTDDLAALLRRPETSVVPSPEIVALQRLEEGARRADDTTDYGALAEEARRLAERGDALAPRAARLAAWAYAARGREHAEQGDLDAAVADFDAALAVSPTDLAARHDRAISLAELGRQEDALAEFDRVIAAAPQWAAARLNRATLLATRGATAEALADCDAAVAAAEPDARGASHAARGRVRHGADDLVGANADFDEAVRLNPNNAPLRVERAAVLAQRNNPVAALVDLRDALTLDPASAAAYRQLAWLCATSADPRVLDAATALEAAQRAAEVAPNDPRSHEALAAARAAAGEWTEAVAAQQRAVAMLGPDGDDLARHRLDAYRAGLDGAEPSEGVVPASHAGAAR